MSLVKVGKDIYIDTDALDQPEYYYYRKVLGLANSLPYILEHNHQRIHYMAVARKILSGYLSAYEIETNKEYEWLKDDTIIDEEE